MDIRQLIRNKVSYKTANFFGVIAYTEENPYMAMVLRNDDYWNSLNARTKNWILFAARPSEVYGHLTDEYIVPQLGIRSRRALPALIVFAIGQNQELLQREYALEDSNEDAAYHSIEYTVGIITNAVSEISPKFISSTAVFREVQKSLDAELAKKHWKKTTYEMVKFCDVLLKIATGYITLNSILF